MFTFKRITTLKLPVIAIISKTRLTHTDVSTVTRMTEVFSPVTVTKHFAPGSTCPEVKPNLMRLYSMVFCPYAQRTRLVLAVKRIPNEVVNINLVTKPNWYFVKNPLGKVPCLEIDGKIIFESLVTADYLDEVYSDTYLLNSKDPYQKAQDRILIEMFSMIIGNFYKLLRVKLDEESWKSIIEDIHKGLKMIEEKLVERGTHFFGGAKPGMVDYMIWPWVERFPVLPILTDGALKIQMEQFPTLAKWEASMKEDVAVKESYISPENHAKFLKGFLAGAPDYDMEMN